MPSSCWWLQLPAKFLHKLKHISGECPEGLTNHKSGCFLLSFFFLIALVLFNMWYFFRQKEAHRLQNWCPYSQFQTYDFNLNLLVFIAKTIRKPNFKEGSLILVKIFRWYKWEEKISCSSLFCTSALSCSGSPGCWGLFCF